MTCELRQSARIVLRVRKSLKFVGRQVSVCTTRRLLKASLFAVGSTPGDGPLGGRIVRRTKPATDETEAVRLLAA